MMMRRAPAAALLLALLPLAACTDKGDAAEPPPRSGAPAFLGAVGHGAQAQGGRGGKIMIVDTLADAGPGSLRWCVEANGPRTCVFGVSGTIRFEGRPPVIKAPFLTIAGQTAPGGGITLAHSGGEDGRTPLLIKNTRDIVVRHIRVRLDRTGGSRGSEDAFTIENSRYVVLDHVSASWARDELVNGYGDNDRITISHSIFAEGIPRHDKCALLASDPKGPQSLSFIGNICAHNGDRNPDLNFPPKSCVEVVNNILYNAQSEFAEIWESFGGAPVSLVGNSFIAGRNTGPLAVGIARNREGSTGDARVYLADNAFDGDFVHVSPEVAAVRRPAPLCPLTLTPLPAARGYQVALESAGAWPRDAVDVRIVDEVRRRGGRIRRETGQIPPAVAGSPYPDADRDGMDDRWEAAHGADPRKPDAWADGDGDGIANLDAFLDERHRRLLTGAVE